MDKKTQVWVLVFLLLIGFGYAYYEYVVKVQLRNINQAEVMIQNDQSDVVELRRIQQNKKESLSKIANVEKELVDIDKALPDMSNLTDFNIQLYYMIKQQGLNVTNVEPSNVNLESGYKSQDIKISIQDSTKNIIAFIDYLKQNPRKIKIKEAQIKVLNIEQIEIDMTIQVFFMS